MKKFVKNSVCKNAPYLLGAVCSLTLISCTTAPASLGFISKDPVISQTTKTQVALRGLQPPSDKVTVAVYGFEDKTGQFKPTDSGQTLSRAVSQGGDEILIKALHDAGNRNWFTIIERSNLNNLLKERQIITEMRSRYLGETKVNSKALPPLLFAGVLFEGGIVGYDTNTVTGGVAARYLGIGGKTDYRQNVVSVHLRAVSVKTGEVLASVTTEKTIASVGISANTFRFVTFDNLLEADAGITSNEPGLLALRQAIEKSVYALIMEGAEIGLWEFRNRQAGIDLINEYRSERDGKQYVPFGQTRSAALTPEPIKPAKKQAAPPPAKAATLTPRQPVKITKKPVAKPAPKAASVKPVLQKKPVPKIRNAHQPRVYGAGQELKRDPNPIRPAVTRSSVSKPVASLRKAYTLKPAAKPEVLPKDERAGDVKETAKAKPRNHYEFMALVEKYNAARQ